MSSYLPTETLTTKAINFHTLCLQDSFLATTDFPPERLVRNGLLRCPHPHLQHHLVLALL